MKIRYSETAFSEREALFDYLEQFSKTGARHVENAVRATEKNLGAFPLSGHITDHEDFRVAKIRSYPYQIYYVIGKKYIEIVHIRHSARKSLIDNESSP